MTDEEQKAMTGCQRNRLYMKRKRQDGYKRLTVWVLEDDVSSFWSAYKRLQKKWDKVKE